MRPLSACRAQNEVQVNVREVGAEGRKFPAVDLSARLHRKPFFYIVNIIVPMSLFALMCNFQLTLPRYDTADRFNLSFTLLLTVVAFKFSMCASAATLKPQDIDAAHAQIQLEH